MFPSSEEDGLLSDASWVYSGGGSADMVVQVKGERGDVGKIEIAVRSGLVSFMPYPDRNIYIWFTTNYEDVRTRP